MGDISELRGLLVTISFLGILVLLLGLIPSQFFTVTETRGVTTPTYWEGTELWGYTNSSTITLDATGGTDEGAGWYSIQVDDGDGDFGGYTVYLWYRKANETNLQMYVVHYYTTWIIFTVSHRMDWINDVGVNREEYLLISELEEDGENGNADYSIQCKHFEAIAWVAYNTSLYSSFEDAWDHNGLSILFAISFDQTKTSYNAFQIISMLLFFQLPNLHWVVNAIIAIPIWIVIAYISYIMILRTIGAVFGGGA